MKNKPASQAVRRQHVANWRQSGVSQRIYCERHGLKYTTFKNWLSKEKSEHYPLVPVQISAPASSYDYELHVGKFLLKIPQRFNEREVKVLATLLREVAS